MINKKFRLLNLLFIMTFLVSACNLPSGADTTNTANTAAAQTLQVLLSATPVLSVTTPSVTPISIPPTLTPIAQPLVTNTPIFTATSNCNVAQFIADVTVPDGTSMTPGQSFVKKWRVKNIGACAWNGFSLVFDSGDAMGGASSNAVSTVNPGQEIDLTLNLVAPSSLGNYRGYWRIVTNSSVLVPVVNGYQGKSFYVDIKVQNTATPTQTLTPTATSIPFAVTSVSFVNSGSCGNFTATANITTNSAGSVTYHFVRSDGAVDTVAHAPVVFASAGTQSSEDYTWTVNAAGSYWIDIYIDTPNRQQFGRAAFNCP
jgi:hypothetical protein